MKKPNLDEECEALLEDKGCKFFNNTQKLFGMQTSASLQAGHSSMPCRSNSLKTSFFKAAYLESARRPVPEFILHCYVEWQCGLSSVWIQVHDIEDLVKVGHSMSACPYFAARHFKGAPTWLNWHSCFTTDAGLP